MTLTEIRAQLMAEHDEIRGLAELARVEAQRSLDGEPDAHDRLRQRLVALEQAVEAHNHHEEELLRSIIVDIDAWGRIRAGLMDRRHDSEHRMLNDSMRRCAQVDGPLAAGDRAQVIVRLLLDHLRREEIELLGEDVLRDDLVTLQGFSG